MRSNVKLFEILVPTTRNDGKPYRTRHHRAWDQQVMKISGGLTIFRPTIGKWISPITKDRREGDLFLTG